MECSSSPLYYSNTSSLQHNITALPREILQHIFAFIPADDLQRNTSKTSKLFTEILTDDPIFWKRKCAKEFYVGVTGNKYTKLDWRKEYFAMSEDWNTLTSNSLRFDPKYEAMASVEVDENQGIIFTNIRPRESTTSQPPITIQSTLPLRPLPLGDFSVGYYEISLLDGGEEQLIGLGLARNGYIDAMPGWKKGSIGYHGDDGGIFIGCGYGRSLTEPWVEDEVIGCGVDFKRKCVFYTKNGEVLSTYPLLRPEGLFATIGSRTEGESVAVNFGKRPFCFDIIKYQMKMTEIHPHPLGQLAIQYSKLVYRRPLVSYTKIPYDDEEDDVEDEDNEFDDTGMNKATQHFNSVLRVLLNTEDYPNDDLLLQSLVTVLRNQMTENVQGIQLAPDMEMTDLRNAVSNQMQFNKQSALLAHFLRVYEDRGKNPAATTILAQDEFPKVELIKCIATLLIAEYRDDHPFVLNIINRGRMLLHFQPPPGMTITQERGQLAVNLSREIQANERTRRTQRRELCKSFRSQEPTFYYYNELMWDFNIMTSNNDQDPMDSTNNTNNIQEAPNDQAIRENLLTLLDEVIQDPPTNIDVNNNNANTTNQDINHNVNNNVNPNDNPNDNPNNNPNNNTNDNANDASNINNANTNANVNNINNHTTNPPETNNETQERQNLSPQQFQEMLQAYVDILRDQTIPDADPRITGAICQWYATLDIDMKPSMRISIERIRLIKILSGLCAKVDEHIEDNNATSFISRMGVRLRRYCKNIFTKENTIRLSLFVMIGLFVARGFKRRP